MNKRVLLAKVCDRVGATSAMLKLRQRSRSPWLPVLTFHRVAGGGPEYSFDEGVVDSTPERFASQVAMIRTYFHPVGLDDVVRFAAGEPLPRNPILITFDDGYKDNFEVALPILKRHGVPAVFFIATYYIAHRRVFWWDRISYIVKTSAARTLRLRYPRSIELSLARNRRAHTTTQLVRIVKDGVGLDLQRFIDELAVVAGVRWNDDLERRLADQLLMTWDDIRALRDAGMAVESHTRTHRVLQTLSAPQLDDELRGSRADLEDALDRTVQAISYPVGHALVDRPDIRRALDAAGYKLGFTNATGAQRAWGKRDPFDVCRMGLDLETPEALFRAMLALPSVFE